MSKLRIQLAIFSMLIGSLCFASITLAQTDEANVQENIKDRLQKVVDEKREQIRGVTSGQEVRGFLASVQRVSEGSLTLETREGTLILSLEKDVAIVQDGAAFDLSDIEIDSQVTVIGYQQGDDFTARRILVHKSVIPAREKTIEAGTITGITASSVQIQTRAGEEKEFSLSTSTTYEDVNNEATKRTDFAEDMQVILISIPENENARKVKESVGQVIVLHLLEAEEAGTPTSTLSL